MTDQVRHLRGKVFSVAQWPLKTWWRGWQWFYRGGLTRALLATVLLLEVWRDFMEDRWPALDALRRVIYWFFGNAVFQAILIPLLLLTGYGLIYWSRIRK